MSSRHVRRKLRYLPQQHSPGGFTAIGTAADGCVDCHHIKQAADQCEACHSQVALRRPTDHLADWVLDHAELARGDKATCAPCHTQTYCQECHDGAALNLNIQGETETPTERIRFTSVAHSGNNLLILQRAHDLNYRYTHGTDVNAKTSDCATCHEMTEFCVV